MTSSEGVKKRIREGGGGVEVEARMKPSLCFVRSSAVRDERMVSIAGCRNAYTNIFPPPGPQKRKGGKKSANMSQR